MVSAVWHFSLSFSFFLSFPFISFTRAIKLPPAATTWLQKQQQLAHLGRCLLLLFTSILYLVYLKFAWWIHRPLFSWTVQIIFLFVLFLYCCGCLVMLWQCCIHCHLPYPQSLDFSRLYDKHWESKWLPQVNSKSDGYKNSSWYRHFYNCVCIVLAAISTHSQLPAGLLGELVLGIASGTRPTLTQ